MGNRDFRIIDDDKQQPTTATDFIEANNITSYDELSADAKEDMQDLTRNDYEDLNASASISARKVITFVVSIGMAIWCFTRGSGWITVAGIGLIVWGIINLVTCRVYSTKG